MTVPFGEAVTALDQASFHALYGPWDPMPPAEPAALLAGGGVRYAIAGGRAARVGAEPRLHGDTDVTVPAADLLAAQLDPAGRDWLADALDLLGHREWARLARRSGQPGPRLA